MTRQTWEEELDSHRIERILLLLEEIVRRLPPPPRYRPTAAIVVVVDQPKIASSQHRTSL